MICGLILGLLAAPSEPVQLAEGASPDGRFEVVLEADVDTPRYQTYALKGGDEDFPAFLLLDARNGTPMIRVPWPGASDPSLPPLRNATAVLWRDDSRAVAINIREPHYWYTLLLVWDATTRSFASVELPSFTELSGRPAPNPEDLRARGVEEAESWTQAGHLVYYFGLSELRRVDYPLTYRATLRVSPSGCQVVRSEAVSPDR